MQGACDRLHAEDAASVGAGPAEQSPASRPQPASESTNVPQMSRLERMLERQGQQLAAMESAMQRSKPSEQGGTLNASKDTLMTPDGTTWVKEELAQRAVAIVTVGLGSVLIGVSAFAALQHRKH